MFFQILSTHLRLEKWKQNPSATKREIGVLVAWMTPDPGNDRPISSREIGKMKNFLRKHAPTSFARLFGDVR